MTYGGNTKKYTIPYPTLGDVIDPDEEQKKVKIIDNQLYGAISAHSRGEGIIREGNYSSVTSGANYNIYLTEDKTQNLPSLEAFINQIYVDTDSAKIWEGLSTGTHYLFARLVESTTQSSLQDGEFITTHSAVSTVPDDGILLATATISGTSVIIDSSPTGKVLIPTVQDHIDDNVDPHGTSLEQTEIITSGITVLGNQVVTGDSQVDGDVSVSGDLVADSATFTDLVVTNKLTTSSVLANGAVTIASGATFYSTVSYLDNITMSSGISIDGRDPSADGVILDAHIANTSNPHSVTAIQAGALAVSGGHMTGDISMSSGIAIDGIDPTTLIPLIDGSDADSLHTHTTGSGYGLPFRYIGYSPNYADTVVSGNSSGTFDSTIDTSYNSYKWSANGDTPLNRELLVRFMVPEDFSSWSSIKLLNKVSTTDPAINVYLEDTANAAVELSNAYSLKNTSWTTTTMSVLTSGATWTAGSWATLTINMIGTQSQDVFVADLTFKYIPY